MGTLTLQQAADMACRLFDAGQYAQAESLFVQVLRYDPANASILHFLGIIAHRTDRGKQAAEYFTKSLALRPDHLDCMLDLGNTYRVMDRLDDALPLLKKAVAMAPRSATAHVNLGLALADQGRWDEAVTCYRQGLALDPQHVDAHSNLGFALLVQGKLQEGWEHFESRLPAVGIRPPAQGAKWELSQLAGRTLFIDGEQGFGDYLQFIRYASLAARHGARVIVGCPREVMDMVRGVEGVTAVITDGDPVPAYDFHCALMSLPRIFATTLDTVPAKVPYLPVDETRAASWKARLAKIPGKKVGLVWSGAAKFPRNSRRSTTLAAFAPLGQIPDVTFFSLQKGPPAQAKTPPAGMNFVDWTDELHSFGDTAAMMEGLDLVISVCTSVVHLAGGRGRPVWAVLSSVADWRWLLDRSDSPWYPTMRLFRQEREGDWAGVIQQVATALAEFSQQNPR